jgi:hypothetical protein
MQRRTFNIKLKNNEILIIIIIIINIGNKGLPGKRFGIPLTTHLGILFLIIQRYFQVKILIKYVYFIF